MLRRCLLVALLLLLCVVVLPLSVTAAPSCFTQCLIDAGCWGNPDPYCQVVVESCRCYCGPPEWCP
jgi:hypothetical protein